jgi:hypothetical protein
VNLKDKEKDKAKKKEKGKTLQAGKVYHRKYT